MVCFFNFYPTPPPPLPRGGEKFHVKIKAATKAVFLDFEHTCPMLLYKSSWCRLHQKLRETRLKFVPGFLFTLGDNTRDGFPLLILHDHVSFMLITFRPLFYYE